MQLSYLVFMLGLVFSLAAPLAAKESHGTASNDEEIRIWLGEGLAPYVKEGCTHAASASTSSAIASCRAYIRDAGPPEKWRYIEETTSRTVTYSSGNGTYWLIAHTSVSESVAGWTRVAGTHYLWKLSATPPAIPARGILLAEVTVASGAITTVTPKAQMAPRPSIDARQHLALDGATSDRAALITLVGRAHGACIDLPEGVMRLDGGLLTLTSDLCLRGQGIDRTIIDITSMTNSLDLQGTLTDLTTTNGAIADGDRSFVVTSAAGINQFDWLYLDDQAVRWNDAAGRDYNKAEWVQAMRIVGTTIYTDHAFHDFYNSGIKVYHLSRPLKVVLKDLTIRANTDLLTGVKLRYALNPVLDNVKIFGARLTGLRLQGTVGARINNLWTYDHWYLGTGSSYGLAVAQSYDALVTNSHLQGGRHAFTTSNVGADGPPLGGVNRRITVANSTLKTHQEETTPTTENYALDLHGNVEFVIFEGNHVDGGTQLAGDYITLRHNIITQEPNDTNEGILKFREMKGYYFTIAYNSFILTRSGTAIDLGTAANAAIDRANSSFAFTGNRFHAKATVTTGLMCSISMGPVASTTQSHFQFSRNQVNYSVTQDTAVTTDGICFFSNVSANARWRSIQIHGNQFHRAGILMEPSVDDLSIVGNTFDESNGVGLHIRANAGAVSIQRSCKIADNVMRSANGHGMLISGAGVGTGTCSITDNVFEDNGQDTTLAATARAGFRLDNVAHALIHSNLARNVSGGAPQQYGLYISSTVGAVSLGLNQLFSHGTSNLFLDAAPLRYIVEVSGGLQIGSTTFAGLGTPADGGLIICTNCVVTSGADNTCASGVGVALAVRLNGVHRCFALQN